MHKQLVALAAAAMFSTSALAAPEMALDATGGAHYVRGTFANFGWTFTLAEPRVLTSLGLWDANPTGFNDPHPVGLWDAGGNLVAQTVVDNAAGTVGSASVQGAWRFVDIAAVLLPEGSYTIGAYYPTNQDAFRGSAENNPVDLDLASWLTYGEARVTVGAFGNQFGRPDSPVGAQFSPGFFGPNFQSAAVPLPASVTLAFAGLLLLATTTRRRAGAR